MQRPGTTLVDVNASIVLVPGASAPLVSPAATGFIGGSPNHQLADEILAGSDLTFALDMVLLADGEWIGPDTKNIIREIQQRDAAMTKLAKVVDDAIKNKRNPRAALAALQPRDGRPQPGIDPWMGRLADFPGADQPGFWGKFQKLPPQLRRGGAQ